MELLIDSNRGVYIPQIFAENYLFMLANKGEIDKEVLSDISSFENEFYWESWDEILNNAIIKFGNEIGYLYHNEDLWFFPEGEEIPEDF